MALRAAVYLTLITWTAALLTRSDIFGQPTLWIPVVLLLLISWWRLILVLVSLFEHRT